MYCFQITVKVLLSISFAFSCSFDSKSLIFSMLAAMAAGLGLCSPAGPGVAACVRGEVSHGAPRSRAGLVKARAGLGAALASRVSAAARRLSFLDNCN